MKRLLYTILLLMFAIATQAQNIPSYVPTNGLVGWWPFNGNANDESGNGNHGTVNGATLMSDRFGQSNSAYNFDGITNYISSNTTGEFKNGLTTTAWIKTGMQFSNYEHKGIVLSRFGMGLLTGLILQDTFQSGGLLMAGALNVPNQISWGVNKNILPNDNVWHHIVGTIAVDSQTNVQTYKIYFDGTLLKTVLRTDNSSIKALQPFLFGKDDISGYGNRNWNGALDDIAIYNRALSQQEITALYSGNPPCTPTSSNFNLTISSTSLPYTWNGLIFNSSGSQTAHLTNASGCDSAASLNLIVNYNIPNYVPTNGLVGWWPFNGNANDESGNGHNASITNAVLSKDRFNYSNQCFDFNNIGSRLESPWSNSFFPDTTTISGWCYLTNNAGSMLLRAGNASSDGWKGYSFSSSTEAGDSIMLAYTDCGGGYYRVHAFYTTRYIKLNTWNHFSIIRTPYSLKIYLNGQIAGSLNNLLPYDKPTSTPLIFGNNHLPIDDHAKGRLDDIAIFNRALTQQEITALYTGVVSYNFTASSGPNGSITPIGTTTLNQGSTQSYTFTPNTGYLVDSVIVDGTKVDSLQGYTFSNVSAHHSIRVTFKVDSNNVSMNFPTGISYQAVARDSAGRVLENKPVKLKFSIRENAINGNTVYAETANLTTNKLGLFNCVIGNNNAIMGNYKNLDWMGASKFLQVELEQGNAFVLLGTQQLLSVPYANAAKEATKIKNAALPIYNSNSDALQGGLKPGEMYRTNAGVLMIVY
jgi:hypothetical protein